MKAQLYAGLLPESNVRYDRFTSSPPRGGSQWFSGICDLQDEPVQIVPGGTSRVSGRMKAFYPNFYLMHMRPGFRQKSPGANKELPKGNKGRERKRQGHLCRPWIILEPPDQKGPAGKISLQPPSTFLSTPQYKPEAVPGVYSPDSAIYFYLYPLREIIMESINNVLFLNSFGK